MKRWMLLATALLSAACAAPPPAGTPATGADVRILTFNIRYGTAPDGPNAWPQRAQLVYDVIGEQDADFVSLQEALRFQIDGIREAVPGYGEVGVGREDGRQGGEYSAILYKTERWQVADSDTFWLSDTPHVPGSATWGNEITRIVTWARFIDRDSGKAIRVYNTHFDHQSQPSRMKSAELLAERMAHREPRDPVVVTGDFNSGEDNAAIRYLEGENGRSPIRLADSFRALHPDATSVGTFGEFLGKRDGPKIDYIFVEPDTRVRAAGIVHENDGGRYPSDHYPVYAVVVLR